LKGRRAPRGGNVSKASGANCRTRLLCTTFLDKSLRSGFLLFSVDMNAFFDNHDTDDWETDDAATSMTGVHEIAGRSRGNGSRHHPGQRLWQPRRTGGGMRGLEAPPTGCSRREASIASDLSRASVNRRVALIAGSKRHAILRNVSSTRGKRHPHGTEWAI
jgi:hypothetical protein